MKWLFVIGIALVLIPVLLAVLKRSAGNEVRGGTFGPRQALSRNEQAMYWRLTAAFPPTEYVVLAEVSFGALLVAKGGASRYSFAQKRADFVLLDKAFQVLAAIELDDSSHNGKEQRDEARDAMLTAAGYRVLRYRSIPDPERLRADLIAPDPGTPKGSSGLRLSLKRP